MVFMEPSGKGRKFVLTDLRLRAVLFSLNTD
jgi:hypothetical protein